MDIEEALKFAEDLVFDRAGVRLNKLDKVVLRGTLEGQTYREIQETEAEAKSYDVDYLSRYVAYELRKRLTEALQAEGILKPGETVRKNNLWGYLEEAQKQRSLRDSEGEQTGYPKGTASPQAQATALQDWGEALESGIFYGRTEELATLEQWIVNERCQLVTLLGMGGIGKTTLAVKLARQIEDRFEYLIWRSLRHAPPLQEILTDLIEFLCDEQETEPFATVADGISQLMEYLRSHRCLVVLDELETILYPGQPAGYYRDGYQDYGELLKRVGEVSHQSCFVLTSREKPHDIALLQGEALPVRSLQLGGLKTEDAKEILAAKGFSGTEKGLKSLIPLYGGNPAALKMVATTIQELFNNNISQFLQQNSLVVGDALNKLLSQQFERLSELEKEIMYWLAIEGKPVSSSELQASVWFSVPGSELLIGLESLLRRSLIEKSTEGREARFTIQPVVMKYVTDRLIEQICQDLLVVIETEDVEKIVQLRDRADRDEEQDEIKESQYRPIIAGVKDRLAASLRGSGGIGTQLNELLSMLEGESSTAVGYALLNIRQLAAQKMNGSDRD